MADRVSNAANKVGDSDALDHGVRLGLVVYGVVHLLIAAAALDLAVGRGENGSASQQGAFTELASTPLGKGVLYVVAAGFLALVVWQAAEAAVDHRRSDGRKRTVKRLGFAGKAAVYAVLAFGAAKKALTSGTGGGQGSRSSDSLTAQLMAAPFGQALVGLVGLGVVGVGGYVAYRGWAEKFAKDLDIAGRSGDRRAPVAMLGKLGHIAKGFSLAAVGALFIVAAVEHQPKESGGLDVALHELLKQPFGQVLVGAVALGLGCFGLYCFAWARHLDR